MESELIRPITDATFHSEIKKGVTLVDFHALWCGPCRMLSPILEEVASHFKGKIKVAKVDIDREQNSAMEFQVTSVPTIILFKDGKEVNRMVGLRDLESLKAFVKTAL